MSEIKTLKTDKKVIAKITSKFERSKKALVERFMKDIDSYFQKYRYREGEKSDALFKYDRKYLAIFDKVFEMKIGNYRPTKPFNIYSLNSLNWKEHEHFEIPLNKDLLKKWKVDLRKYGLYLVNSAYRIIEDMHMHDGDWYNEHYDEIIKAMRTEQNKILKLVEGYLNEN